MMKIVEDLKENKAYLIGFIFLIIILLGGACFVYFYLKYDSKKDVLDESFVTEEVDLSYEEESGKVVVEIKGEVVNPGVYEVNLNKRVNDVILLAGGLTSKADTSVNNLSKKVTDEMLIIIYSKDEINNYLKTKEEENLLIEKCESDTSSNENSCIEDEEVETDVSTSKISLNTATKEELMTLPGIGESKALAIIEYRNKNKFTKITDVKKVSGIGESLYDKIKDYITT